MKKQFITGFLSGALIFGVVGALAATYTATDNPFPVKLNGNDVQIEGYNIEGSTYFKLRDIADTVGGFEVGFQNDTIQLSKDGYVYEETHAQKDIAISDNIVCFARVGNIDDKVYVTPHASTNGGFKFTHGNVDVNSLPTGMVNLGDIYSFCYYNNRIYYLTGMEGSDTLPANIYSCDVDGTDNQLIAENATNNSKVYIVDNIMYYDEAMYNDADYYSTDNICAVNLNNGSTDKIVNGKNIYLVFCDSSNLYYCSSHNNREYYSVDYSGKNLKRVDEDSDEVLYNNISKFIKGDTTYYISGNKLYSRKNNDYSTTTEICEVPQSEYQNSYIMNVDETYIYYSYFDSSDIYHPEAKVFRIEKNI